MILPFVVVVLAVGVLGLRYRRTRPLSTLPWPTSTSRRRAGLLNARVETTTLNRTHDELVALLDRRDAFYIITRSFYDAGTVFGALGVVFSLGLLLYYAWTLFTIAVQVPGPSSSALAKRASTPITVLKPLIPGLTTPLADIVPLGAALLLAQTIHELGHAIAAALPPAAAQLACVGFALPGAFVALVPSADAHRFPWARGRNAAAGPWHNIVLWLVLTAASGPAHGFRDLVWRDVSADGRVILAVEHDSPLAGHLSTGAIVTALDDVPLGSSSSNIDLWQTYLLDDLAVSSLETGWCVEREHFHPHPSGDCTAYPGTAPFSPFPLQSFPSPADARCLDPLAVFRAHNFTRCTGPSACTDNHICVAPAPEERLLRLIVREHDHAHTIVWKGPRSEVFDQVRVGHHVPRIAIIPTAALPALETFFGYLMSLTLALAALNLLPLRALDGGILLGALLDFFFPNTLPVSTADAHDVELGRAHVRTRRQMTRASWRPPLERGLEVAVGVVGTGVLLCTLWVWIRAS